MNVARRVLGALQRGHDSTGASTDVWRVVALGSPRWSTGGRLQQLLHAAQTCESSRREAVTRLLHEWDSPDGTPGASSGGADGAQVQQAHAQAQANELLRLCARQQAIDDAMQVIAAMERRGVAPDADTFAQLHDVFSYFPQPLKPASAAASSSTT